MKKLLIPFILFAAVLFQSCSGPRGPQGPAGKDGLIGQTFEVEKVNFNASNDWQLRQNYPANVEVLDSDVILVYILWDATTNGQPIWRLLPQAIDMPRGITYNFDFTPSDYTLFIDAPQTVNLGTLSSNVTQNQTFRIVAIPSDFPKGRMSSGAVDFNDYESVKKFYNLDETKIQKITVN